MSTSRSSQSGSPLKVGSNTPEMIAIGRKLAYATGPADSALVMTELMARPSVAKHTGPRTRPASSASSSPGRRGDEDHGDDRAYQQAADIGPRRQRRRPDPLEYAVVAQHRDLGSEVHVGGDDHAEGQDARHEDGGPLDVRARQVRAGVGRPDQQQNH